MANVISSHRLDHNKTLPILFSCLSAIFSILTSFFIAKPLGNDLYGVVQYYIGLITLLQTAATFGLNFILTKFSQFESDKKAFFTKYFFLYDILFLLCSSIFGIIAFFGLQYLTGQVLLILIVCFDSYFLGLDVLLGAFYLGIGKAAFSSFISSFLPKFVLFLGSLLALWLGGSDSFLNYYLLIFLLSNFLGSIPYVFFNLRKTKFRFSKSELTTVFFFFLLSSTQTLNSSLAKVIQGSYDAIGKYPSLNGVLGLSLQVVTLTSLFSNVITTLLQPVFSRYSQKSDFSNLILTYKTGLRINSYIGIPFCLAFLCQPLNVLSLFGSSYSTNEGVIFFVLVSATSLVSTVCGPCGTLLTFSGHEKLQIVNGLILLGSFSLLGFGLLNVTEFGIGIAYLVSEIIVDLLKLIEIKNIFKISPLDLKTLLILLLFSLISFAAFFSLSFIHEKWLWFLLNVIIGVCLIAAAFFFTPYKKDKYFFENKRND